MARLVYIGTSGSEDPTRSVLPFLGANAAVEEGHQAEVIVMGDAVVIMKDVVRDAIVPVGWPPLRELMGKAIDSGVPIYV